MKPLIAIHNATVYRGDTKVFDSLTLRIPGGRHTAILGPNGAGKTTLLKLLTREIYPAARADSYVELFGQASWNIWDLRAHLGIVSQDLQNDYLPTATGLNVVLSGLFASMDVWEHQRVTQSQRARARHV